MKINNQAADWDIIGYTAQLFIVTNIDYGELETGIKYTQAGMLDRVRAKYPLFSKSSD